METMEGKIEGRVGGMLDALQNRHKTNFSWLLNRPPQTAWQIFEKIWMTFLMTVFNVDLVRSWSSQATAYVTILDCFSLRFFHYNKISLQLTTILDCSTIWFFTTISLLLFLQFTFSTSNSFFSCTCFMSRSSCPFWAFIISFVTTFFIMYVYFRLVWSCPIKYGMINNRNSDEASTSTCDERWRVLPLSGRDCWASDV